MVLASWWSMYGASKIMARACGLPVLYTWLQSTMHDDLFLCYGLDNFLSIAYVVDGGLQPFVGITVT